MKQADQKGKNDECAQEVIQQERVICTVAADLLIMNKLLEDGKKKSAKIEKKSFIQTVLNRFKTTLKKNI